MVKAKEIRDMKLDDAALDEIADPHFSEIVSTLDRRNRHVIGHKWSFGDGQENCLAHIGREGRGVPEKLSGDLFFIGKLRDARWNPMI